MKIELSNDELLVVMRALRCTWGWCQDGGREQTDITALHRRLEPRVPGAKERLDKLVRGLGRSIDKSGLTGL